MFFVKNILLKENKAFTYFISLTYISHWLEFLTTTTYEYFQPEDIYFYRYLFMGSISIILHTSVFIFPKKDKLLYWIFIVYLSIAFPVAVPLVRPDIVIYRALSTSIILLLFLIAYYFYSGKLIKNSLYPYILTYFSFVGIFCAFLSNTTFPIKLAIGFAVVVLNSFMLFIYHFIDLILLEKEEKQQALNALAEAKNELQKISEQKILDLQNELNHFQKMELLGRIASGVAHDFNNILTVISSSVQVIQMGWDDLERKKILEYLDIIDRTTDRAADLTKRLLSFSRQSQIKTSGVNLNRITDETIVLLISVIGRDIAIKKRLSENINDIQGNETQIQNAIMNLAINARDAIKDRKDNVKGKITFYTGEETIKNKNEIEGVLILPSQIGQHVFLTVEDNGVGIPKENILKVFEPFFTTKEVGKGTGLGLSTIHGVVRSHHGFLKVDSKEGKGTAIKLYFPIVETSQEISSKNNTIFRSASSKKTPSTIMLVEDEEGIRNTLKEGLKMAGHQIDCFSNGLEANNQFKISPKKYTLVISDIMMPKMNGEQLAKGIRAISPSIPILLLSGYTKDSILESISKIEKCYFMKKPFPFKELISKIENLTEST